MDAWRAGQAGRAAALIRGALAPAEALGSQFLEVVPGGRSLVRSFAEPLPQKLVFFVLLEVGQGPRLRAPLLVRWGCRQGSEWRAAPLLRALGLPQGVLSNQLLRGPGLPLRRQTRLAPALYRRQLASRVLACVRPLESAVTYLVESPVHEALGLALSAVVLAVRAVLLRGLVLRTASRGRFSPRAPAIGHLDDGPWRHFHRRLDRVLQLLDSVLELCNLRLVDRWLMHHFGICTVLLPHGQLVLLLSLLQLVFLPSFGFHFCD